MTRLTRNVDNIVTVSFTSDPQKASSKAAFQVEQSFLGDVISQIQDSK